MSEDITLENLAEVSSAIIERYINKETGKIQNEACYAPADLETIEQVFALLERATNPHNLINSEDLKKLQLIARFFMNRMPVTTRAKVYAETTVGKVLDVLAEDLASKLREILPEPFSSKYLTRITRALLDSSNFEGLQTYLGDGSDRLEHWQKESLLNHLVLHFFNEDSWLLFLIDVSLEKDLAVSDENIQVKTRPYRDNGFARLKKALGITEVFG